MVRMPSSSIGLASRKPIRKSSCTSVTLIFLRWGSILFVGYYLGSLQSSYYYASSHHEQHPTLSVKLSNESPGYQRKTALSKSSLSNPDSVVPDEQIQSGQASAPDSRSSNSLSGLTDPKRHGICGRLAAQTPLIPSATDLWFRHYIAIHKASQLSTKDIEYKFYDFTAELLHLIAPRLPQSTVSLPRDWTIVKRILDKAEKRLDYLQHPERFTGSKSIPSPVKIVVLGGSVLVGRNCRKLVSSFGTNLGMQMPNRECTYSFRLQVFLDQITHLLLHPDQPLPVGDGTRHLQSLFQVTKIAVGGTNTAVGSQIFKYDLIPDEARQADIVLNSYATNDMHILTILEIEAQQKTLREGVFDMLQDFVRTIMRPNDCKDKNDPQQAFHDRRPLLLHLDDYLGNEQRNILQTMELSQSVSALAQYYGFGSISYANVVRDWVYGDTHEYWFSPEGWWRVQPDARKPAIDMSAMQREIHPGMGMHIATTWIISYNLLHIASNFCSLENFLDVQDSASTSLLDYKTSSWASKSIPLKNDLPQAPGRPRPVPRGLPPKMNSKLMLDDVSEQWRNHTKSRVEACDDMDNRRCPFSWVSGLSLQQNNISWVKEYFGVHTRSGSEQWKLLDEDGKIGFLAQGGQSSSWVLEFGNVQRPISTVTVFFLKSYGDKWKNSNVLMSALVSKNDEWQPLAQTELLGTHAKNTSEMYTQDLSFRPLSVGQKLRIVCQLQSGSTFKLMGLAICQ